MRSLPSCAWPSGVYRRHASYPTHSFAWLRRFCWCYFFFFLARPCGAPRLQVGKCCSQEDFLAYCGSRGLGHERGCAPWCASHSPAAHDADCPLGCAPGWQRIQTFSSSCVWNALSTQSSFWASTMLRAARTSFQSLNLSFVRCRPRPACARHVSTAALMQHASSRVPCRLSAHPLLALACDRMHQDRRLDAFLRVPKAARRSHRSSLQMLLT